MRSKEERERQILDAMHGCSLDQAAKISKAIDDEAAQSVAEFKERLKEAARNNLPVSLVNKDTFLTLIDETK